MPRSGSVWRALAILVVAVLAGCNAPEVDETRPTPRVVSRPPTATPPAELVLVILNVSPNETELGTPVEVVALVANEGRAAGGATVAFEIVGGASVLASTGQIAPGASAEARANLTPGVGGNLAVRAVLDDQETTVALVVRAPRLANLTVRTGASEPCGALRLTIGLENVGDAAARNVRASLDVMDEAEAPIVSLAPTIGDVAPGARGEATVEVPEARAACEGEDARIYVVRLVVHADHLADVQLTGVVTA